LTKARISATHGRFNGIRQVRQCAHHLIHASLGPPESTTQTESRSVQPFLHSSCPAMSFALKIALWHGAIWTHLIHGFLGPPESTLNGISIGSAVFAQLMPGHVVCPKNCPLAWGDLDPSNTWFLVPTRVHIPNGIWIGSAVFAGPPNTDHSVVFARLRQCAPHVIHASLGPPECTTKTASRLIQPFLYSSQQSLAYDSFSI